MSRISKAVATIVVALMAALTLSPVSAVNTNLERQPRINLGTEWCC
ncbi:MAG: hypothetical protein V9G04_10825 [Nocardioides sp.]|jgi:hypothetical protein